MAEAAKAVVAAAVLNKVIAPLSEVLAYQNTEVRARFCDDFSAQPEESEEIFRETLRWLWFCAYQIDSGHSSNITVPLLGDVAVIDKMWHTFLLFTRDYAEFCDRYFHFFIHHIPQTQAEKKQWRALVAANEAAARESKEADLRQTYETIYDVLGEDVLLTWMEVFPEKYSHL